MAPSSAAAFPEIPAVISAVVQARAGRDWRRQLARVTAGEHFGLVAELRAEAAWVLRGVGYADAVVAKALGVSVVSICRGRKRLRTRLEGDAQLRAWFEAILPPAGAEVRAVAA